MKNLEEALLERISGECTGYLTSVIKNGDLALEMLLINLAQDETILSRMREERFPLRAISKGIVVTGITSRLKNEPEYFAQFVAKAKEVKLDEDFDIQSTSFTLNADGIKKM